MAGREPKPREAEAVGFEAPFEFLDGYVDDRQPFEGLYAHFAEELDTGHPHKVLDYVEDLALDVADQAAYGHLLQSMLEQTSRTYNLPPKFRPTLDAAVNYVKYRLSVGVMEPAITHALSNTLPEHTRVRVHRTIVAADMVRVFINDSFSGAPDSPRPTSLLDQEVEGHVRQHFSGRYKKDDEAVVDQYLNSTAALEHLDRLSDGHRMFDIRDYSTRVLYPIRTDNGVRLPEADELAEIFDRQKELRKNVPVSPNGHSNGHGTYERKRSRAFDDEAIRRQTVAEAFRGTGVLRELDDSQGLSYVERVLPGSCLEGREIARAAAATLLGRLGEEGYRVIRLEPDGARAAAPEEVRDIAMDRLQSIVARTSGPFLPADAFFKLLEDDYIQRYGEPPTTRDYWD